MNNDGVPENLGLQIERFVTAVERGLATPPPQPWWKKGWIGGLAATLVAAGIGFFLALGTITSTADRIVSSRIPNSDNLPLALNHYQNVTASSYRQDVVAPGAVKFPRNVLDSDPKTSWEECKGGVAIYRGSARMKDCEPAAGDKGEWIRLRLTSKVSLKAIRVRNGHQSSTELFIRNPRVKDLTIELSPGNIRVPWHLRDEPGYQSIDLQRLEGKGNGVSSVRFVLRSDYRGETFLGHRAYSDTSISDIQLIPDTIVK